MQVQCTTHLSITANATTSSSCTSGNYTQKCFTNTLRRKVVDLDFTMEQQFSSNPFQARQDKAGSMKAVLQTSVLPSVHYPNK